jgi:hypothetical protein
MMQQAPTRGLFFLNYLMIIETGKINYSVVRVYTLVYNLKNMR